MFQGWVGSRLEALGAYAFWVISNAWFGAEVNYRTLIETLKGTLIDPLIGTLKGSLVLVLGGVGAGSMYPNRVPLRVPIRVLQGFRVYI